MFDVYDSAERAIIGIVDGASGKEHLYVLKEDGDDWRLVCPRKDCSYDGYRLLKMYSFSFDCEASDPAGLEGRIVAQVEASGLGESVEVDVGEGRVTVTLVCPKDIRRSDIPDGLYVAEVRTFLEGIISQ